MNYASGLLIAVVNESEVFLFGFSILFVFFLLFAIFYYATWARRNAVSVSPYTGMPLRRAADIPYESARKVLQFLYDRHEYENPIFDLKNAAVCRETGRIFPNCVTWLDTVNLDWDFINKRFPGTYVSWGSLSSEQQTIIREAHENIERFQTVFSSPEPSPREVEPKYAYAKPGPLYVDFEKKTLLGWQSVPDTMFEVLIVQRPILKVNL